MNERIGKQRAVKRWREQGRTEQEIEEGLANWGQAQESYQMRKIHELDSTNPFLGMSFDELSNLRKDIRRELSATRLHANRLDIVLGLITRALAATEPRSVLVSDHAVLRYIERKMGIDVNAVREEIRERVEPIQRDDGGRIIDLGDVKFIVSASSVSSVVRDDTMPDGVRKIGLRDIPLVVTTLSPHMDTSEEEEARRALAGEIEE